jgi:hypothetical protein
MTSIPMGAIDTDTLGGGIGYMVGGGIIIIIGIGLAHIKPA